MLLRAATHPACSATLADLRTRHTIRDLIDYWETLEFLDAAREADDASAP